MIKLEEQITTIVDEAVARLAELADDNILKQAVAEMALRDFAWRVTEIAPGAEVEIAEHLGYVAQAIADHPRENEAVT